jgi:diaminopimelate epimerase
MTSAMISPMRIAFTKMHGLGNDFLIVEAGADGVTPDGPQWRRLADRHAGVGFDQALLLEPARTPQAAARYRVYNADGSEAEQSGNGARCIARYLQLSGRAGADGSVRLDSARGPVAARVLADGRVTVDLGVPDFEPRSLPFKVESIAPSYVLEAGGERVEFGAVSIGNPHAVVRVAAAEAAPVQRLGRALQEHPDFPCRVNVGFMEVVDAANIRLRVYERGAGETLACGTGACAAVAVGRQWGLLDRAVEVHVPGGRLGVHWEGAGQRIWLTGPAEVAFTGQAEI